MRIGGRWSLVLAVVCGCQNSPISEQPLSAPTEATGGSAAPAGTPPGATAGATVPAAAISSPVPPPSPDSPPDAPTSDPAAESKREALETIVRPFLAASVDNLIMEEGPFGPAARTIVVVTFAAQGRGDFSAFALVPDRSATSGYRKLPMPWLPSGSTSGEMEFAAIGNLDRDAALEVVITTQVIRTADAKQGGYTYDAFEPVVLDWDARRKRFTRLAPVEARLKAAFTEIEGLPTSEDVSKALGIEQ